MSDPNSKPSTSDNKESDNEQSLAPDDSEKSNNSSRRNTVDLLEIHRRMINDNEDAESSVISARIDTEELPEMHRGILKARNSKPMQLSGVTFTNEEENFTELKDMARESIHQALNKEIDKKNEQKVAEKLERRLNKDGKGGIISPSGFIKLSETSVVQDDLGTDIMLEDESLSESLSTLDFSVGSAFVSIDSKISLEKSIDEERRKTTAMKYGPLIGAIDEGTSSTRFLVFASKTAEVLTYHQEEISMIVPREGWYEQDPMEILAAVKTTLQVTCDNLAKLKIDYLDIAAIGITNQRETTILWDKYTGKPLFNAIVWLDLRTTTTVDEILKYGRRNQYFLQHACGLPVSTYFSALKIKWLMDNVPEVLDAIEQKRCLFGTIDTWLIWNLSGGKNGGMHVTDVTNASRTMLMNIDKLQWDPYLCEVFGIPMNILPEIRSSSELFGCIVSNLILDGVPITGVLGDQQAALVGQMCLQTGQAKCTYGTGCFILYNTGPRKIISSHGLLTTVAYQFGPKAKPVFALEGSVAVAGVAIKWLKDKLNVINKIRETTDMALSATPEGEVIFVPAFSGLYAPYWRKDARGVICGISEETKPAHLVKAALEAVCFQVRDVLQAMTTECKIPVNKLLVDGGMTVNDFMLQMQADYCGIPVVRPTMTEATSLGAAIAAGIAEGVHAWEIENILPVPCDTFIPQISEDEKDMKYTKWKKGIDRSLNWAKIKDEEDEIREKLFAAIPAGLFLIGAAAMLVISEIYCSRNQITS